MLDLDFVRAQFPSLSNGWAYLENAGGSQILGRVGDLLLDFFRRSNVQLGANYDASRLATRRVNEEGAGSMATLINASDPSEIIFGNSTSENLKVLSEAMASQFKPGDEIITTNVEHEANVTPWLPLVDRGVELKVWKIDRESLSLRIEDLKRLLSDRTRLVAVNQVSNILGTLMPIDEIVRLSHEAGAKVVADGVAYAPHRAVDVRLWDVDYYAFSLYKVYGPHQAVLYGKRALLEELDTVNHYFIRKDDVPYKFQLGSLVYELVYASRGVLDYLVELGGGSGRESVERAYADIAEHEERLSGRMLGFLKSLPNVRIIGEASASREVRVPTISFVVEGRDSAEIPAALSAHRIGCRNGHFYAARLIEDLGLQKQHGVVRISMVHYNTLEEVDRLIRHLEPLLRP